MSKSKFFFFLLLFSGFVATGYAKQSHALTSTDLNQPLSTTVMKALQRTNKIALQQTESLPYTAIQGIHSTIKQSPHQRPLVLYVGAEFCPFCAALRWPLTIALMRFGTLSNLRTMRSTSHDIYPDTTTITFTHSRYLSDYIHFQAVETETRNGHPLQPLNGIAKKLFLKFDAPPYAPQKGGIPFLYIGGQWLMLGSPVTPSLIGHQSWTTVTKDMANPQTKIGIETMETANLITAAICRITNSKPTEICQATGVKSAAKLLPPR